MDVCNVKPLTKCDIIRSFPNFWFFSTCILLFSHNGLHLNFLFLLSGDFDLLNFSLSSQLANVTLFESHTVHAVSPTVDYPIHEEAFHHYVSGLRQSWCNDSLTRGIYDEENFILSLPHGSHFLQFFFPIRFSLSYELFTFFFTIYR